MTSVASLILLSQVLAASLFCGVVSTDLCSPEKVCEHSFPGNKTADPLDCHKYYLCIESRNATVPSDQPLFCPPGEYYNAQLGACLTETSVCGNPCLNHNCSTECNGMVGIKTAYPGDCNKYYACVSFDEKIMADCPEDKPYFDGTECSVDRASCCVLCQPYCEKANTEVVDPFDCRGFYLCLRDNTTPDPSQRYECGPNMHFDSEVGTCVADEDSEQCENLCNA